MRVWSGRDCCFAQWFDWVAELAKYSSGVNGGGTETDPTEPGA